MSRLSCDGHGGPFPGRALGMYPTLLVDGKRWTKYRRLCAQCMSETIGRHRKEWQLSGISVEAEGPETCMCCGQTGLDNSDLRRFFCTAYVRADQRVDYYSFYCQDCSAMVVNEFSLEETNGRNPRS